MEDHGASAPVVLVQGYLADGRSRENQSGKLLSAALRQLAARPSVRASMAHRTAAMSAFPWPSAAVSPYRL
jgi:hypothetical protein